MIMELYRKYKDEYNEYVLLIKSGNFYLSLNKDAYVMHNIFNYQLKDTGRGLKVGFPINSIEKIKDKFELIDINYLIIEDGKIVTIKEYENNQYKNFVNRKNYGMLYQRIDKINETLKKRVDDDIENTLTEIERLLCMID